MQPRFKNSLYRCYTGEVCQALDFVNHADTGETMILYRDARGQLWAMHQQEFFKKVWHRGEMVWRFVPLTEETEPTNERLPVVTPESAELDLFSKMRDCIRSWILSL